MILEKAAAADATGLAAVHAGSFCDPWDARAITEILASPGVYCFLVRETQGAPATAFALARAIGGEAELLTLAVAPAARRRGMARTLLAAVAGAAEAAAATSLFLEVAQDNGAALALYEALGFKAVGRRPGYYRRQDGTTDALILRCDLNTGRP